MIAALTADFKRGCRASGRARLEGFGDQVSAEAGIWNELRRTITHDDWDRQEMTKILKRNGQRRGGEAI
jgi:hypothetical protein